MSTSYWTSRGKHAAPETEWPDDEEWHARITRIAEAAVPTLEELLDEIPASIVAMVCTGDGFNLCTVGLNEDSVGQFAALSGLLHSVSLASVNVLPQATPGEELEVVSAQTKDLLMLCVSFEHADLGTLILATAAQQTTLGELLLQSRITAGKLAEALARL